jgi:hypothetical protein
LLQQLVLSPVTFEGYRQPLRKSNGMRNGGYKYDYNPIETDVLIVGAGAAEAVLRSALVREESRGAHHRKDFPAKEDGWRRNVLCARGEGGGMHLWTEPVHEVPAEIQKALDEDYSLDYHYLE